MELQLFPCIHRKVGKGISIVQLVSGFKLKDSNTHYTRKQSIMMATIMKTLSKTARSNSCLPWKAIDSGYQSTRWDHHMKRLWSLYLLVFGSWFLWHMYCKQWPQSILGHGRWVTNSEKGCRLRISSEWHYLFNIWVDEECWGADWVWEKLYWVLEWSDVYPTGNHWFASIYCTAAHNHEAQRKNHTRIWTTSWPQLPSPHYGWYQ